MRLGLGSGFHAMTGDTRQDDHMIDSFGYRNRGMKDGKDSSKSRKIAFTGSGDDLKLYPMGFVQLCSEEYYNQHYKVAHENKLNDLEKDKQNQAIQMAAENEAYEKAKIEIEHKRIQQEAQELNAKAEALLPKIMDITLLKKAKWVDGIVTGQNGAMLVFKPYVTGHEDLSYEIRYNVGMPINTVIQVMCSSPNGKILQLQGAPRVKT